MKITLNLNPEIVADLADSDLFGISAPTEVLIDALYPKITTLLNRLDFMLCVKNKKAFISIGVDSKDERDFKSVKFDLQRMIMRAASFAPDVGEDGDVEILIETLEKTARKLRREYIEADTEPEKFGDAVCEKCGDILPHFQLSRLNDFKCGKRIEVGDHYGYCGGKLVAKPPSSPKPPSPS